MADPVPTPAPTPSIRSWAFWQPIAQKAAIAVFFSVLGAVAHYYGFKAPVPDPTPAPQPVPVVWLGEPGQPFIAGGAGQTHPTFGWVRDANSIAENLDPAKTQHFDQTPAGKVVQGNTDTFLWRAVRKAAGNRPDDWYPNIDQGQVGCCVGCGWKHAADVCLAVQVVSGKAEEWHPVSAEAIYALSRVQDRPSGARPIRGDGSVGAWAQNAVSKDGLLAMQNYPADGVDLSVFSPSRARSWGNSGLPAALKPLADQHPVKGAALVKTWADVKKAVQQGYPVAVCSDQGFTMTRDATGTCKPHSNWGHCMAIIGVRTLNGKEQGFLENSWGDKATTGPVSPSDAPPSGWWADSTVINSMVSQGDSFALSDAVGFPARVVPIDWFSLAQPKEGRLGNVSPLFAGGDLPHRPSGDSILHGELESIGGSLAQSTSNVKYVRRGEFGAPVPLTNVRGSVAIPVGTVLGNGVPSQIAESVICPVSVVMTALHSVGSGSDECDHDEFVNRYCLSPVIDRSGSAFCEDYELVSLRSARRIESSPFGIFAASASRSLTPNRTIVPDAVVGKIRDLFVNDRRLFLRHDRLPVWGGCV